MKFKAKDILPIGLLVFAAAGVNAFYANIVPFPASELPDNVVCEADPILHPIHQKWICYIPEE